MNNNKGFSLIEVIISALVLTLVFVGLIHGLTVAALERSLDDQRSIALGLARFHMEESMSAGFAGMQQGTTNFSYTNEIPNSNLVVSVRIQDVNDSDFEALYPSQASNPATDYRTVTVTSQWTPPSTHVQELISLVNLATPNSNSVMNE